VLTTVMIDWVTQSYDRSPRYFYEAAHDPWTPLHGHTPLIEAPTGISELPKEFTSAPRRWIQRYYSLKRSGVTPAGSLRRRATGNPHVYSIR
jgi:hypothetical protein